MKTSKKTNKICDCFGGEISPLKALKTSLELVMHTLEIRNSFPLETFTDVSTDNDSSNSSNTFPVSVGSREPFSPLIVSFQLDTHTLLPPAQRFVQPSPRPLLQSPSPSPTLPLLPSPSTFPMATLLTRAHGHPEQQQSLNLLHPL